MPVTNPAELRTLAVAVSVARWRWGLAVAVTGLTAFVATRSVEWEALRTAGENARERPLLLAAIGAAYTGAFVLRALAWRTWLRNALPLTTLHAILQTSLFLNHLLPLKAGEVARPALAALHGVRPAAAVSTTVIARLADFFCLALIAFAAIPLARGGSTGGYAVLAVAVATVVAALGLVALRRGVPARMPGALAPHLAPYHSALAAVPLRTAALAVPLTLASWALESGVLLGASRLMGAELSVQLALGATAFTILFQVAHFTPGGIGVYEAAMTTALISQGVPAQVAVALAVVTHGLKFAYSFTVAVPFAVSEGVFALRGKRDGADRASRLEIVSARAWNVLNEGKPFTPVFAVGVLALLAAPQLPGVAGWPGALLALAAVAPLAVVFFVFDFPLRLRWVPWAALGAMLLLTGFDWPAIAVVTGGYLGFTVVLWGTVYYHLRIGTAWTNGFRFVRLVFENPDPTSGNLLEQLPKLLMLVLAARWAASGGGGEAGLVAGFGAAMGIVALLSHYWWFRWVPALPQPRLEMEGSARAPQQERLARRVIVIAIDGCRDDRLREARTPCIDRLRSEGTDFAAMSTVYPARTVTCFSSMLTGAAPETHGMRSNFVPSLGLKCESIFDSLRRSGMRGKLVGIAHLIDAFGERDVHSVTAVTHNDDIDAALVARAKRTLSEQNPELLVLQLLSVDQTGHARGSYFPEYLAKIEETDRAIEEFLSWCGANGYLDGATVIVTADHGQGIGIGGHGHLTPTEVRIPCILWGAGIEPGRVVDDPVVITDIAPTIAWLLGAEAPAQSAGRVLGTGRAHDTGNGPVVFVVPAHNEEASLPAVLAAIASSGIAGHEVVVVDDGSTDGTAEVARKWGAHVVSHGHNRGLGAALRTGLAAARGLDARAAVYLDADGEYDAREAQRLLAPIRAGTADYVTGSRFAGGGVDMAFSRKLANRAFSLLLSGLCRRRIGDAQSGFRAFSARALDVAEIIHDYNYAQVLTLDLARKGMPPVEVPISYRRRQAGRSFIRGEYLWRVPLGMLREMVRP